MFRQPGEQSLPLALCKDSLFAARQVKLRRQVVEEAAVPPIALEDSFMIAGKLGEVVLQRRAHCARVQLAAVAQTAQRVLEAEVLAG